MIYLIINDLLCFLLSNLFPPILHNFSIDQYQYQLDNHRLLFLLSIHLSNSGISICSLSSVSYLSDSKISCSFYLSYLFPQILHQHQSMLHNLFTDIISINRVPFVTHNHQIYFLDYVSTLSTYLCELNFPTFKSSTISDTFN